MSARIHHLMLEGFFILVAHIHRNGTGIVWFTADGIELVKEEFHGVYVDELPQIKAIFPMAKAL